MKIGYSLLALTALLVSTATAPVFAQTKRAKNHPNYRIPTRAYQDVEVGSRTFVVEQELLQHEPEIAKQALERLNHNIELALTILPPHSHQQIAKQQFWMMYGPAATGGGEGSGLSYFRPGSPQHNEKRDERWNRAVVVYCAKNYGKLSDLWALKAVLHELAHAYQLEQWPEKEARILAAYDNAMANKLYLNVENDKGGVFEKAYAMQNQLEYFAEISCMFFARCNYRPYDRNEFRVYDPVGYRTIREVWKIGDPFGQHEQRTWSIGSSGKPLQATFDSIKGSRVALIDSTGTTRTLSASALGAVDRDYLDSWHEGSE